MDLQIRDRVREVAEGAKEGTEAASRAGRSVGVTAARETVNTGTTAYDELSHAAKSARETADTVRERVSDLDPELVPDSLAMAATTDRSAATLATEIRQFVDAVDHRYAAKSALRGARHGYIAGPYGAVLGGGVGTVYGAYSSTRAAFDPDESSQSFVKEDDIERYLDGVQHARTGYEVGKRFGTKGKVAGAAIGAGVSTLPLFVERVSEGANADDDDDEGVRR